MKKQSYLNGYCQYIFKMLENVGYTCRYQTLTQQLAGQMLTVRTKSVSLDSSELLNFNFDTLVTGLTTKYGADFNVILPFTPLVSLKDDRKDFILNKDYGVKGGEDLVELYRGGFEGYCMDPLNKELTTKYLAPMFSKQASLTNSTSAFWLNKNTPLLKGNNMTSPDPFLNLPYYPGEGIIMVENNFTSSLLIPDRGFKDSLAQQITCQCKQFICNGVKYSLQGYSGQIQNIFLLFEQLASISCKRYRLFKTLPSDNSKLIVEHNQRQYSNKPIQNTHENSCQAITHYQKTLFTLRTGKLLQTSMQGLSSAQSSHPNPLSYLTHILSLQVLDALLINNLKESFVLSDDTALTYSGNYRIAHLFPKQHGSYQDLTQTLTNLINFGLFSIPFTGGSICAYSPERADQNLCARYFQLAIVSPLAILDSEDSQFLPTSFDTVPKQAILASLQQRYKYLNYMRTQLMRVKMQGGTIFIPLFAVKGFTEEVQAANDLSSIMWGDSIKVDFQVKQGQDRKIVNFPAGSRWVNLNTNCRMKKEVENNIRVGEKPQNEVPSPETPTTTIAHSTTTRIFFW